MGKKAKVLKHQIKKKRKRIRNEKRQVRKNIAKFEKTGEFERQQEEIIRKETDLEILKKWLKQAARASSVEGFVSEM